MALATLAGVRRRVFDTPLNAVLTLAILALLALLLPPFIDWAIIKGSLTAPDDRVCQRAGGACWSFIAHWWRFIFFGRFPYAEQWRPGLVVLIFLALILATLRQRLSGRWLALAWTVGLALVLLLMTGGVFGMSSVETDRWNGLPLTLILAAGGIAASFPLALLLALGRRSRLPAIRTLAVVYIEVARGVPFIAWLFAGLVLLPLFLPPDVSIAKLWRAEAVFALFIAAYVAEVIRGGLQAIPRGQYEAASALGLGYVRQMRLVILPQALAIAIPGLVNTFIGAFKDTALVSVIGMFDLLQDTNVALNDPDWRLAYAEAYIFIAGVYFVFCYALSLYSRRLEARLRRARA